MLTRPFQICLTMLLGLLFGCMDPASNKPATTPNPMEQTDTAVASDATVIDTVNTDISVDRQTELTALVQEWIDTHNDDLIHEVQNLQELQFVEELLKHLQDESDTGNTDTNPPSPPSSLPTCSGYWGSYRLADQAELLRGSGVYAYYWSPNCSMAIAPGTGSCPTDRSYNMVSFWMGPDYSLSQTWYRADSSVTNSSTYWDLVWHGGAAFRVYTSNAYGAWYGNAYVCLATTLDPSTLRFGREY